jgi:hypothetical protein
MKGIIYVPKTVDEQLQTNVRRHVADKFGGYTELDARGGWVNDQGNLVEEPVTVLHVVGASQGDVQGIARWLAAKSDETEVLWEHHKTENGLERPSILGEIEAEVKSACATNSVVDE